VTEHSEDVVLVAGGESRQQSVHNGLEHVESNRVVVHDAARPFVTVDAVQRVLDALDGADGAVTATPLEETLKRVSGAVVVETVERKGLYRVQTPQAFRTSALKAGHRRARSEGFEGTDDAQLVERYGGLVCVVAGSRTNLKLTFAEDFRLAEAVLRTPS
jgi:2-C-methyl-D-erythritol 4-phosphate cytidylyltransferase